MRGAASLGWGWDPGPDGAGADARSIGEAEARLSRNPGPRRRARLRRREELSGAARGPLGTRVELRRPVPLAERQIRGLCAELAPLRSGAAIAELRAPAAALRSCGITRVLRGRMG